MFDPFICRTKNKPYLLIDFAEFLGRNVYGSFLAGSRVPGGGE